MKAGLQARSPDGRAAIPLTIGGIARRVFHFGVPHTDRHRKEDMAEKTDSSKNEKENDIITLTGDDGKEEQYELLDMIDYSGTQYAVLVEADPDAEQVQIFKVEDADEETNTLTPVASQETANAIFELFKTRNSDKYDFS
jgi:uncharacterized protein YrzB (UPF0473 family)